MEQMPEVFSRLRSEMKNSKTLADSLQQLQQSIELMKQEKAEIEVGVFALYMVSAFLRESFIMYMFFVLVRECFEESIRITLRGVTSLLT